MLALLCGYFIGRSQRPGFGPQGGGTGFEMQATPPAMVRFDKVQRQQLQQRFELIGRLQEVQKTIVAAEVAGKIVDVPVDEGSDVTGGASELARIDDVWAKLDLAVEQADVEAALANLDQAQRDLKQLEQLLRAQSAKPKEVEDARSEVKTYAAELERAIARRDRALQKVERLKVVAPFDGIVTRKLVENGQWVQQGSGVVEMISRGRIDAAIDVPERYINQVTMDKTVEVVVEPLQMILTGRIVAINPFGRNAARTFPVKVRLDDQNGLLKPGMSVLARVPMDKQQSQLTVPRDAVLYSTNGSVVWVAVPQGAGLIGLPMPVKVLFGENDRYAVLPLPSAQGIQIQDGMDVVIEGAERLFPTQPLVTPDMHMPAPTDSEDHDGRSNEPST